MEYWAWQNDKWNKWEVWMGIGERKISTGIGVTQSKKEEGKKILGNNQ